jgi:hypothetical protein
MNQKVVFFEVLGQPRKKPFEVFVTPLMVPEAVLKSHGYEDCCVLKTSGFLIRDGADLYNEIESGDTVYVGGSFTNAGGHAAYSIARWDGSSWSGLGSGMGGVDWPQVLALALSAVAVVAPTVNEASAQTGGLNSWVRHDLPSTLHWQMAPNTDIWDLTAADDGTLFALVDGHQRSPRHPPA